MGEENVNISMSCFWFGMLFRERTSSPYNSKEKVAGNVVCQVTMSRVCWRLNPCNGWKEKKMVKIVLMKLEPQERLIYFCVQFMQEEKQAECKLEQSAFTFFINLYKRCDC